MFVCALRPLGEPLSRADVFGSIARLKQNGAEVRSIVAGPFAAFAVGRAAVTESRIAQYRQLVGAGDVRLDHRADVARLAGVRDATQATDLELVLAAIDRAGEACIREIIGDFAFVVWDARAQKLLAVRDALGVKPLFQRNAWGMVLFASEVGPLQHDEAYDRDYIHAFLQSPGTVSARTVWQHIAVVPAGSIVRFRGTVQATDRYWRATDYQPADDGDEEYNCNRFRELLERGVQTRLTGRADVWSQLSGGLDSSAVVALTELVRGDGERLGGTITVVDALGEGDERAFSDALVGRFQLRNEQVSGYWAWQDDGESAPVTDQPTPMYPFFARERQLWRMLHAAGCRVLLSGFGADHYLAGSLDYITDLMERRRCRAALRELAAWSVATRQSIWTLGRRYLIDPFLPPALQPRPLHAATAPAWLITNAGTRLTARDPGRAPSSHRFAALMTAGVHALPAGIELSPFAGGIETRYPFLYRPLVEWSLRLPAQQRIRPHATKWILRQAMRDVLPNEVRTRTTKGGIDARILWSLQRERACVDALLRDPVLAQLGCIEPAVLRAAVDAARRGVPVNNVHLFSALSLETWLAVRAGKWPDRIAQPATAA